GCVTLKELRLFAYERTYQLLKQRGLKVDQDGECHWSLSLSDWLRVTKAGPRVAARPPEATAAATNSPTTDWVRSEELGGDGRPARRSPPAGNGAGRHQLADDGLGGQRGSRGLRSPRLPLPVEHARGDDRRRGQDARDVVPEGQPGDAELRRRAAGLYRHVQ